MSGRISENIILEKTWEIIHIGPAPGTGECALVEHLRGTEFEKARILDRAVHLKKGLVLECLHIKTNRHIVGISKKALLAN